MSDDQKAAEKALDLFVYAPVGVALYLRDTVPTFVNLFVSRGRAELGQRRQQAQGQVAQAKALGEFAVNFGGPKVREHVEKGIAMARKSAESVLTGVTCRWVTPASRSAAMRSCTRAGGPMSVILSMKSSGSAASASSLRPSR